MFSTAHDVILLAIALVYLLVWAIRAQQGARGAWIAVPLLISGAAFVTAVLW